MWNTQSLLYGLACLKVKFVSSCKVKNKNLLLLLLLLVLLLLFTSQLERAHLLQRGALDVTLVLAGVGRPYAADVQYPDSFTVCKHTHPALKAGPPLTSTYDDAKQ